MKTIWLAIVAVLLVAANCENPLNAIQDVASCDWKDVNFVFNARANNVVISNTATVRVWVQILRETQSSWDKVLGDGKDLNRSQEGGHSHVQDNVTIREGSRWELLVKKEGWQKPERAWIVLQRDGGQLFATFLPDST